MKLVKNIEIKDSECKHEQFADDIATDKMFSVVECVPIPDQKVLKLKLEGGDTIIIPGEIIDVSGLNPGEKRLKAVDSDGNQKIAITLFNDGKIKIEGESQEMVDVLSKALQNIIDYAGLVNGLINGISTVTIPTALGGAVLSLLYPTYAAEYAQAELKKTDIETSKTNLDTFLKV